MKIVSAAAATLLVTAIGAWSTWTLTDGMRAFTTENARRLDIERQPRPVSPVAWQDASADIGLGTSGPVRIVDFVYTRCASVCRAAGGVYAQLQQALALEILQGRIELLSIGFDLEHDTPEALEDYRRRHGAGAGWRASAPRDAAALASLRQDFGVLIVPDGDGGFVHNAALSVVDASGRLVAVDDLEHWPAVAARSRALAGVNDVREP